MYYYTKYRGEPWQRAARVASWGLDAYTHLTRFSKALPNPSDFPQENSMPKRRQGNPTPPKTPRTKRFRPAPSVPFSRRFSLSSSGSERMRALASATSSVSKVAASHGSAVSQRKSMPRFNNSSSSGVIRSGSRKNITTKAAAKGAYLNYEVGGLLDSPRMLTIGHCNFPKTQLCAIVAFSLVKAMAIEMKRPIEGWDNVVHNVVAGDRWSLVYRNVGDDTSASLTTAIYISAGGADTWLAIASAVSSHLDSVPSAQTEYLAFIYTPNSGLDSTQVPLNSSWLTITSKSTLKVQNTSVPSATEHEADDVHNIPIYGKAFTGKGVGSRKLKKNSIFTTDVSLLSVPTTGIIARVDATVQGVYEPGTGYEYENVKKISKVKIDPGNLHTSTLYGKISMSFNMWVHKVCVIALANVVRYQSTMGNFRFVQLEKMIEPVEDLPTAHARIAYEHNNLLTGVLTFKRSYKTQMHTVFL